MRGEERSYGRLGVGITGGKGDSYETGRRVVLE